MLAAADHSARRLGPALHLAAPVLALAFGLLVIVYFFTHHYVHAFDDAFISYKYAANLARGRGLVFNTGERVWGFTSPLETLLLGVLAFLGLDIPTTGFCLSILWISLTAWILFRLCLRLFPGAGAALLVSLFFLTWGRGYEYLGLETNLLLYLQCLFLLLTMEGKYRWAAVIAGLSCLARPDSLFLVAPVIACSKESRKPANLALFLVPGLLWLSFAYLYYGNILPNTFYAKKGADPFWLYLRESFKKLTAASLPEDLVVWIPGLLPLFNLMEKAGPWLLPLSFCSLANAKVRRTCAIWYALIIYPWVLLVAYSLIEAPLAHSWETYSALFFFRVATVVGLFSLLQILVKKGASLSIPRRVVTSTLSAAVAGVVLVLIVVNGFGCFRELDYQQTAEGFGGRNHDYRVISRWINEHLPAGSTLGLLEVGTIGYYTDMHIIDMCGLITKGVRGTVPPDYVGFMQRFRPEYMLVPNTMQYALGLDQTLWYQPMQYFPKKYYWDYTLLQRSGPA